MREVQSPSIATLIGALVKAQAKIGHAIKDAKNPHFKKDYATLEAVIDATKCPLAEQGLVVLQQPDTDESGRMILITTLAHTSGEWMRSFTPILTEKQTAQGLGSGITYSRRYALAALCNITQADDDGNEASGKAHVAQATKPQVAASNPPSSVTKTAPANPPAKAKAPTILKPGDFEIRKAKKEWEGRTIEQVVAVIGLPKFQKEAPWWWETSRNKDFAEIQNFKRHAQAYFDEKKLKAQSPEASEPPADWQDEPWPEGAA